MIVYLNGQLVEAARAAVSPFDRGFVFGDGVYEGLRSVVTGPPARRRVVGLIRHVERMRRGLAEARIPWDAGQLPGICESLLDANGLQDGFVYVQVTRGTPDLSGTPRSRVPVAKLTPTVFGYCNAVQPLETFVEPIGKACSIQKDERWGRGTLKCISLMGNVLPAMAAADEGAEEAILVRDGLVSEGTATNVVCVLPKGGGVFEIVTPALGSVPILAGVTRDVLLESCPEIVERALSVHELRRASEIILIGTTTMVASVTSLDGVPLGDGRPGPVARDLLARLVRAIRDGRDDLGIGVGIGARPIHGVAAAAARLPAHA